MGRHHFESMWDQAAANWQSAADLYKHLPEFLVRGQPSFERSGLACALLDARHEFLTSLAAISAQYQRTVPKKNHCDCLSCQAKEELMATLYCRRVLVSPLWWTWDLPLVETPQTEASPSHDDAILHRPHGSPPA